MEQGKKKIYIGIIAALFILIIGLVIGIVAGGKDKKSEDTTAVASSEVTENASTEEKTVEETSTAQTTTEATSESASEKKEENASVKADFSLATNNGWESGSDYFCQYDFVYENKQGKTLSNWQVVISGCEKVELSQNWNCEVEKKDGKLIFTPVEYNQKIENSQKLEFGFIVSASSKEETDKLAKNATLTFDGETAGTNTSEEKNNTEATEEKTEEKTEQATEKSTEENKSETKEDSSKTPFENHGKLTVKGTDIVDKDGNKFQLKGVSTHGIAWFPEYVNKDAFKTIRDEWGGNLIRLAMYTDENGGYCSGGNKKNLKSTVDKGVTAATELGMYVIIDWHILHDLTPLKYQSEAEEFFAEMSLKYKDYDNIIYEICNEPNGGTSWADVKKYAEAIIPIIRKNDPDAIIVVGTPTWSQDVDKAAENPITGYDNIMYTVHFYAATHKDDIRNKLKKAREKGLAIFVTEFSICDASGNGALDKNEAGKWMDMLNEYNISYAGWSLCNKDESSALISSGSSKKSGWSDGDLSEAGKWLIEQFKK